MRHASSHSCLPFVANFSVSVSADDWDYYNSNLNNIIITGASDVWQSNNGNFYALITTTTDVAIYDLKTGDKTPVLDGVALAGYAAAADLVPITNGENASFLGQVIGAATIFFWVFIASGIVWYALKIMVGIRISEEDEYRGIDASECGLEAYPEFKSGTR